jgi:hypothetical protein
MCFHGKKLNFQQLQINSQKLLKKKLTIGITFGRLNCKEIDLNK